jgi:hypothetical protein
MIETDKNVATIRELERLRCDAIVVRDFDVFAAVAHPELTWIHTNGATDTLLRKSATDSMSTTGSTIKSARSGFTGTSPWYTQTLTPMSPQQATAGS